MICTLIVCHSCRTFVKWSRQLFQKVLCASLSLTHTSLSLTNFMSIPEHKSCVSNSHMSARQSECSVFSHHLSHFLNVGRPQAAVFSYMCFLICRLSTFGCSVLTHSFPFLPLDLCFDPCEVCVCVCVFSLSRKGSLSVVSDLLSSSNSSRSTSLYSMSNM